MTTSTGIPRIAALAVLGLSGQASAREITHAYRRLAKTTHPDITGQLDPDAGRRFAALTEAYEALSSTPPPPPSPPPPPTPAVTVSLRRPVRVSVRFARPPIVAGPVRMTPSPPTPRESA